MKAISQLNILAILAVLLVGCSSGNGPSQEPSQTSNDTTPPVITLTGNNPQIISVGEPYVELGATADDNRDGDLTASIVIDSSLVDSQMPGQYEVTYDVSDSSGNAAVTVIRTVIYEDRTPPVITLLGDNPQTITEGNAYAELGATATDNVDGDLTNAIIIDDSTVDTNTVGSYDVSYDVEDSSGNAAITVVRTVNVEAPLPPNNAPVAEITAPADLGVFVAGDDVQFTGSGADTEDGALSGASLVWVSDIDGQIGTGEGLITNTLSAGTHRITLTATDSSGGSDSVAIKIRVAGDPTETYGSAVLARQSELFRVEVKIGGNWVDTDAYQYSRQSKDFSWYYDLFPTVHWTTIGVSESYQTDIRITRLNRPSGSDPFVSVELLPSRYSKNMAWDEDTISFSIEQNEKVYVRTNDQDFDTLFVSAIPLKSPVPDGALYFGPGQHDIGIDYELQPSDRVVYLDGGSWVIGSLHLNSVGADVRVIGPGVLSGEFDLWENVSVLPWEDTMPWMMIHTDYEEQCPAFDVRIEGITIVASPFFNLSFNCLNGAKYIDNLHIISPWTYNTDGLGVGSRGQITNTFVFNNDDTIHAEYLYDGSMSVSNSVFAGRNPFLIGYGYFTDSDPHEAVISNVDVLLQHLYDPFHGEIDGRSPEITIDNQRYENIRIDGDVDQLIYLSIEDTPWGDPGLAQGNVRDILFEDITVTGNQQNRSIIRGKDQDNRIDNIRFVNLRIGGILITEANKDQFFDIDEATTTVSFSP